MTPKQAEKAFERWWEGGVRDNHPLTYQSETNRLIAKGSWLRAIYEFQAGVPDLKDAKEGRIAIQGNRLAIFGSAMGFLGPVLQGYVEFDDRKAAIEEAKAKIRAWGLPLHEEISRPHISKMTITGKKG